MIPSSASSQPQVPTAPEYFSLRRANPFLGTLQVVKVGAGRALSADGIRWQIELLARQNLSLPLWGDGLLATQEPRYFRHGSWSSQGGLTSLPVNAILGDQGDHPALRLLLDALSQPLHLPFPLVDTRELWLLDPDGRPLALLASRRPQDPPPPDPGLGWRALPDRTGAPPGPDPLGRRVEELISTAAGHPPHQQWFDRPRENQPSPAQGASEPAFPELLVRVDWASTEDRELVAQLVERQAPALLTLPDLSRDSRRRLESLAAQRPLALYRYRKLLPDIIDRKLMEAAWVQAVLRGATAS